MMTTNRGALGQNLSTHTAGVWPSPFSPKPKTEPVFEISIDPFHSRKNFLRGFSLSLRCFLDTLALLLSLLVEISM